MTETTTFILTDLVREAAHPLNAASADYDELMKLVGNARLVLLGEASHGTHEFYRERAQITKRLIREKGFNVVAVEADWPDAYRINRYVRGAGDDHDSIDALAGFRRFPAWMWRNADVLDFVGWLREHNESLDANASKAGFYGLDLYSLHASIEAVLHYLDKVDPEGAMRARSRYACFDHFGSDLQAYGYAASFGMSQSCEDAVVNELVELQRRASEYARRDGRIAADEFFHAEQNARLVRNAERYYRTMFRGRVESWNLRDTHMAETLESLVAHLEAQGQQTRAVIWAHNSHLGDARATEMGRNGEVNVGRLIREHHRKDAVLVGFTTNEGTVTAASNWDGPAERKVIRPALPGSFESLFHKTGLPRFMLALNDGSRAAAGLCETRLERAIGVIYLPETERVSHYFHAQLARQFDAILHFDHTRAVEPLERNAEWDLEEVPETFPTAL